MKKLGKIEEGCSCPKICKYEKRAKRRTLNLLRNRRKLLVDKVTFVYGQNLLFPVGNEEKLERWEKRRKLGRIHEELQQRNNMTKRNPDCNYEKCRKRWNENAMKLSEWVPLREVNRRGVQICDRCKISCAEVYGQQTHCSV